MSPPISLPLDEAAPRRGEVVWLHSVRPSTGFTGRDRAVLHRWAERLGRAVVFEEQPAEFAMLYVGVVPWASWAVARQGRSVVAWDCVTLVDIGHFESMTLALQSLCGEGDNDDWPVTILPFVLPTGRPAHD